MVVFSTISILYFYYSPVTGVLITLTTASQQHITSVHERFGQETCCDYL